ncbi:MAG: NADH-quinone oxidoreductase subunit N [Nitrososphaerota archaeon]|nr:NADH-quinone oxidoreductase subunit N [Nitrososphaerota archaeon]
MGGPLGWRRLKTDFILFAAVVLGAAAIGLPFFQLSKRRDALPGCILAAALGAAILLVALNTVSPQPVPEFGSLLSSDTLGGLFGLITLSVTLGVTVFSIPTISSRANGPLYYSLLGFSALGMLFLSFAADLLILFIAWELMSLPTYALAGFDKTREESNEASAKYAILGALSSAIILYAISLSYGLSGSTQISSVIRALGANSTDPVSMLAILLFVVGFGFKMSVVPFHMWVPDTYEGAPITISTLFAAATKKAGFVAAIRVVLAASTLYVVTQNPIFTIPNIFAVLALVTMTLGNLAALTQKSMTRLLAYSSIAQAGYILIGFVIYSYSQANPAYAADATLGMTGALFHIINHSIMVSAAFLAVGLVLIGTKRADLGVFEGLAKRAPVTAFTLSVSLLALAGVPPLNGFWSKLLLFLSVVSGPFAWLAVAAVLNSAFSVAYYVWIIKRMYMDEPENGEKLNEPLIYVVIFAVLAALMIGLGLFPQIGVAFSQNAVPSILSP